ncbi:MAG: helix-turn-helix domain-containing protein [Deltaproteobacteria bacterium]|nr:helix-turn-helix domain-containing protein [Deltaproteobacteria bacterium]
MLENDTEKIIGRLKEALDAKSDGQLAKNLGISRQNIGAARKREDVPTGWIYKVAELTGCSMDWLGFGKGPKIRVEYTTDDASSAGRVASPEVPYGSQGKPEKGSAAELQQEAEGSGLGAAVEMLARIYSSGDRLLINAIHANIRAICETIESRKREQRSTEELEELKKRLIALEKPKSSE